MNAILTGSQAYGIPTSDSDVDLVVLVDEATLQDLLAISSPAERPTDSLNSERYPDCASLRFGRLNLIATASPEMFATWVVGTAELKRWESRPARGDAISVLSALRDRVR